MCTWRLCTAPEAPGGGALALAEPSIADPLCSTPLREVAPPSNSRLRCIRPCDAGIAGTCLPPCKEGAGCQVWVGSLHIGIPVAEGIGLQC